jgi:hydroxyacid-oxoacid transhydrogenase
MHFSNHRSSAGPILPTMDFDLRFDVPHLHLAAPSASCPCHSNPAHHHHGPQSITQARRTLATPIDSTQQKEYAFEMAASSIRFGPGCTKEVGMDLKNMGAKRVMVVTDGNVRKLEAMKQTVEALEREGVQYEVFDKVRVEPKDSSIKEANEFSKSYRPDAFLAVGGGSVIDTAKLMNLYTTFPGMIRPCRMKG